MKRIKILLGDITTLKVDAIVNAANSFLWGGAGVDGAIHKAAGQELLFECIKFDGCETGDAVITKGYNLLAKHVIHTVGPVWRGGNNNEENLLRSCYIQCLDLAIENDINSIAFPCISTGVYLYPQEKAAKVAYETVSKFIECNSVPNEIIFCCFLKSDYKIYQSLD